MVPCLSGCNGDPEFAEVEGVVTLDGKPLPDVEVAFLPDPEKGNKGPRTASYTDEQGRYRLHCEKPIKDGAVLGPHRVCIIDVAALPTPPPPPGFHLKGQPMPGLSRTSSKPKVSRVPAAYSNPALTPFRDIEVKRGTQTLNFDIPSGKRR
jgi:hypothetical protein